MELYQYFAIGGAAVIVLALMMQFASLGSMPQLKLPAIITGTVGGLAAGVAVGMIALAALGYEKPPKKSENPDAASTTGPPPMGGPGFGGPPGGGGPGGPRGPGGPGGPGGFGPNYKRQLILMVDKLEMLTQKSLTIELTAEKKQEIQKQIVGLESMKELNEEEAKKRLEALQEILKENRDTLTSVGYRWTGEGRRGRPPELPPNPFTEKENGERLKALQSRLGQPKAG